MSSNFPGALDTTADLPDNIVDADALSSPDHATLHNVISDAVIAVETKLGIGSTTPTTGTVLSGTATGTSSWVTSPQYNVRAYGATGNGSTDDTTAVQNAINAAHSAGGGVVTFPAGTYKLTSALTVYTHVTLQGVGDGPVDGAGAGGGTSPVTLKQTGTSSNGLTGVDVYDFAVKNLTLSGPGSGTGVGLSLTRSGNGDCRYITLEDMTVQDFGSHGITIDLPIVSRFERVVSYGNGGNGFNIVATGGAASTSCAFISCWAHNNSAVGWNINTMVYSSFASCAADNSGTFGYLFTACQGVSLTGCGAEANTSNGLKITGCYNMTVNSYWNFHNSTIALYVTGSSQSIQLTGIHENTPTGSPTASIKVDSGCTATLTGLFVNTATSVASGTLNVLSDASLNTSIAGTLTTTNNVLDDGSGNIIASGTLQGETITALGTSGDMVFSASPDGGDYNIAVNTTGTLALFGSASAVLDVNLLDGQLIVTTPHTPASAADTGTKGQIAWDTGFLYVCTATNTWTRVAIATW